MGDAPFLVRDGQWAAERAREMILWAGWAEAKPEHVNAVAAFLLRCEHERSQRHEAARRP